MRQRAKPHPIGSGFRAIVFPAPQLKNFINLFSLIAKKKRTKLTSWSKDEGMASFNEPIDLDHHNYITSAAFTKDNSQSVVKDQKKSLFINLSFGCPCALINCLKVLPTQVLKNKNKDTLCSMHG